MVGAIAAVIIAVSYIECTQRSDTGCSTSVVCQTHSSFRSDVLSCCHTGIPHLCCIAVDSAVCRLFVTVHCRAAVVIVSDTCNVEVLVAHLPVPLTFPDLHCCHLPHSQQAYPATLSLHTHLSLALSSPMSRSSSALGLRAGSTWTCDECQYVNKAKENECGQCPTSKPDPYDFRNTATNTRLTRSSQPTSSSPSAPPLPPRVLRSSTIAAAADPAPQYAVDRRTRKRRACTVTVRPAKLADDEAEDNESDTERLQDDTTSDSDDESLQLRYQHNRPKRHCAQQTQHRLHTYYRTTKHTTATTNTTLLLHHKQLPLPVAANNPPTLPSPALPPTRSEEVEQTSTAVVVGVPPAAFVSPPLAATPFVPATREETVTLLNRVHATLALSAFPTTTSALLPSRTLHLTHLCTFLSRHLTTRTPAALYIAGRPGVGKTLTVDWALQTTFGPSAAALGSKDGVAGGGGGGRVWRYSGGKVRGGSQANSVRLPVTTVVTVNAIALMKGHGSFWCKLLALLTSSGRHGSSSRQYDDQLQLPADEALHRLHQLLAATHSRREMIVLVVDEIDALLSSTTVSSAAVGCTSGSSGSGSTTLLHALFRLVYAASSCVVLLSISNNITLLDSHCSTLAATHSLPERVVFSTYSQADLLCILQERLLRCLPTPPTSSHPSTISTNTTTTTTTATMSDTSPVSPVALPFFAPAALEFICKATSKDTGDIRRCLRDCRHAVQQLLTTCIASPQSAPFRAADCQLTVSSLARVKAEREAATQHGRLSELSVQQLHVLWVVGLVGGVLVGRAGECYRRCVARVRGSGLIELSGSEVCAVVEMLESEGMVRKDKQGKVVRYVSVVSVERMRRQLRGDIWPALWSKAALVQSVA